MLIAQKGISMLLWRGVGRGGHVFRGLACPGMTEQLCLVLPFCQAGVPCFHLGAASSMASCSKLASRQKAYMFHLQDAAETDLMS